MKKLLCTLIIFITCATQAQEYKDGYYTKVIKAEGKSIDDIRASVREWVSESYGSAESVIDLDTETKMIVKGQLALPQTSGKYRVDAKFKTTLTISYKESRFKVDLRFNTIFNPLTNTWDSSLISQYNHILANEALTKDEFFEMTRKAFKEKNIAKMGDRMLKKKGDSMYADYLTSKKQSNEEITRLYNSIETKVNSTSNDDDDW